MKIKESSSKSKYSTSLVVFGIAAVILTVLRLVQIKTSIDASTGFYSKTGLSIIIFYALLFMSCLYFAVSSFLMKKGLHFSICKGLSLKSQKDEEVLLPFQENLSYYEKTQISLFDTRKMAYVKLCNIG